MSNLPVAWTRADEKFQPWSKFEPIADAISDLKRLIQVTVQKRQTKTGEKTELSFDHPQDAAQHIEELGSAASEMDIQWKWTDFKDWSPALDLKAAKSDLEKYFPVTNRPIRARIEMGDEPFVDISFGRTGEAVKFLTELEWQDADLHKQASDEVLRWIAAEWDAANSPAVLLPASSKRSDLQSRWKWKDAGFSPFFANRNPFRWSSALTIRAICEDIAEHLKVAVKITNRSKHMQDEFEDVQKALEFLASNPICTDGEPKVEWMWTKGGSWNKTNTIEATKDELLKQDRAAKRVEVEVTATSKTVTTKTFNNARDALQMLAALEAKVSQEHGKACKSVRDKIAAYVQAGAGAAGCGEVADAE